jgi:hypothetical protein
MNKEHVFSFIVQCALGNHNPFDILSQGFLRGTFPRASGARSENLMRFLRAGSALAGECEKKGYLRKGLNPLDSAFPLCYTSLRMMCRGHWYICLDPGIGR